MPTAQVETPPVAVHVVVKTESLSWWRIVLLGGLVILLYYRILGHLALEWWQNPNFSHGFLVPGFSLFVAWRQRNKLRELATNPSWSGLAILGAALLLLIVGVLGAELFLSRTSFVLLIAGLIVYFLGVEHFRTFLFPWAFLFLMIPLPMIIFNQIAFPLQLFASQVASSVLPLFGVPILREGNLIQLPAMTLEVADACSGIRSLMSLTTLALIYGYLIENSVPGRFLLVFGAVPIAVVANATRIVGTGLLVQYWNPDKALGFFHEFSGWVIFVVAFLLLFLFHRVITLVRRVRRRV